MSDYYSQWHDSLHDDEPRDQDRDLVIPHLFGEAGPDGSDGWSWSIVMFGDGEVICDGFADTEEEAKAAVDKWEKENYDQAYRENSTHQ
jgi:hypothetical protein